MGLTKINYEQYNIFYLKSAEIADKYQLSLPGNKRFKRLLQSSRV